MSVILIKNGRVLDPVNNIDRVTDVLVRDGIITEVADGITDSGAMVVDAFGLWVAPGLIDLHVHLREPGYEYKETIETGALAAAKGGFTTICCMANTNPAADCEAVIGYIKNKAQTACVNVLPIGCATKALQGLEPTDIGAMIRAGACAVSDDGRGIQNGGVMKTVLKRAADLNIPVMDHCEEDSLAEEGQGGQSVYTGLPAIAEEVMVARDVLIAETVPNARLHICHISTKNGVRLVAEAKKRGINVTAEAAPHHFTLTQADITNDDGNFKMNPPLRTMDDVKAIKEGLRDGVIDCIATDHAPHHADEKNHGYQKAANGIVGLETALALAITELVLPGYLTPLGLIKKMSANPAGIIGINKGALSPGFCADITLIDPNARYTVDANSFVSKSRNTPFRGRAVTGKAVMTIRGGNIIYIDGLTVTEG